MTNLSLSNPHNNLSDLVILFELLLMPFSSLSPLMERAGTVLDGRRPPR